MWGSDDEPFEWTWIELLEFLAESWRFLTWEETYPLGLSPRTALSLEDEFERRREYLSTKAAARAHDEVLSFLDHHDLACALRGATAPPVRILRMGELCAVATQQAYIELSFDRLADCLTEIGQTILARLDGATDRRSRCAVQEWHSRTEVDEDFLLEFGANLPEPHWGQLKARLPSNTATWNRCEIFAAARMAGRMLSPDSFEHLLESIERVPLRDAARLDDMCGVATKHFAKKERAFLEGYEFARQIREFLGHVDANGRIDVEEVLTDLGVEVRDIELDEPSLDAIAVFGPAHGPAVLVNVSGLHAKGPRGRRATLAHELCHLLLDRGGALAVVEVLGGKAPRWPEQRANAFAAELLVPGAEALAATRQVRPQTRAEWQMLVRDLGEKFQASQIVAAWQTLNANEDLMDPAAKWLEGIARS